MAIFALTAWERINLRNVCWNAMLRERRSRHEIRILLRLDFGDYGGMPMKFIWALLNIITTIVLISGLYLSFKKREIPTAAQLDEIVEWQNEEAASGER